MKSTTELDGPPQQGGGLAPVGRVAPDAAAGDAHGAEAQPPHCQVGADVYLARRPPP